MAKWLGSGRRRDVCYLLAAAGEETAQGLKTALEDHYDERIDPKSFYAALGQLEDAGIVESRVETIQDVYSLTEGGRARLEAHHAWATACLEG